MGKCHSGQSARRPPLTASCATPRRPASGSFCTGLASCRFAPGLRTPRRTASAEGCWGEGRARTGEPGQEQRGLWHQPLCASWGTQWPPEPQNACLGFSSPSLDCSLDPGGPRSDCMWTSQRKQVNRSPGTGVLTGGNVDMHTSTCHACVGTVMVASSHCGEAQIRKGDTRTGVARAMVLLQWP